MSSIGFVPPVNRVVRRPEAENSVEERPTMSRLRELLAVLAVLLLVAGLGALMVACTRGG